MSEKPSARAPRAPKERTERVFGLAAARATLDQRIEHVLNIAHTPALRSELAPWLQKAARHRIAYREVEDEELARIAGSMHHEGICLLVREREAPTLRDLAARTEPSGMLVALDRVSNPHNAGAVLRSAAFFGARGLVIADPGRSLLTPAAVRVAEGGAEHVPVVRVPVLDAALAELQRHGMTCIGAAAHGKRPLPELRWRARTVLVLGREDEGLSPAVAARCEELVFIPGSGAIDSLNVSVAAGILLASYAAKRAEKAQIR